MNLVVSDSEVRPSPEDGIGGLDLSPFPLCPFPTPFLHPNCHPQACVSEICARIPAVLWAAS